MFVHVAGALFDLIRHVLLHLGHINYATLRHFLEFGVINVCPVDGKDVVLVQFTGTKHEMVVCGRRGELHIAWYALIALDARVYLYAAFLLSRLGIASNALEHKVGEEADDRGVDYLQLLHPFRNLARGAVQ